MTKPRKAVLVAVVFLFVWLLAASPLLVMLGMAGAFDSWGSLLRSLRGLTLMYLGALLFYGVCLTFVDVTSLAVWVLGNLKERAEMLVGSLLEKRRRRRETRAFIAALVRVFKEEARAEIAADLVTQLEPELARRPALLKAVLSSARSSTQRDTTWRPNA